MARRDRAVVMPSPSPLAESGQDLVYGQILHLEVLLSLQPEVASLHDDLFFVVVHQSHELWFKVLLHELESARDHIATDQLDQAIERLGRVRAVERLLAEQVEALRTLEPASFGVLRDRLGTSSGFQSAQFREIELLSGLKDGRYLAGRDFSAAERARLRCRYHEPSLREVFEELLRRRGPVDLAGLLQDGERGELARLAQALRGHDQGFYTWRSRHLQIARRLIGDDPGTAGTSGFSYLQATLDKRFFPGLWEAGSQQSDPG
jgi:tryptophan 2,3-dioxygenase